MSAGKQVGWLRIGMKFVAASVAALLVLAACAGLYTWWVVARLDTQRFPDRHGQVNARLYMPSGAPNGAPRPLIVGVGGSEGGNAWAGDAWKAQRERFLAQGYAVLALGYFGMPGTPERLDRISIDAIHDQIVRAASQPGVDGRCIAMIGGSRGGELSLLLASRYADIDAVVALVPAHAVFPGLTDAMTTPGFSHEGRPLPFVPMPWRAVPDLVAGRTRRAYETMIEDDAAVRVAAIPVERIAGPILFLSASEDEFWPSREMSDAMMRRLREHGHPYPSEHRVVQGGHAEPLDEFPKVEAFLRAHLMHGCGARGDAGAGKTTDAGDGDGKHVETANG